MKKIFIFLSLITLAIVSNFMMKDFKPPFLGKIIFPKENYIILDIIGPLCGLRKAVADIAWIQLLQYYGTEEGEHKHGLEYGGGRYYDLLDLCKRVVNLDPYFYYAYIYGGASLAWNLKRFDEALELLKMGIEVEPNYWDFYIHKSAIIYRMLNRYRDMVRYLELAASRPKCPAVIKSLLASIYKKDGKLEKALRMWHEIYQTSEERYKKKAIEKMNEIKKLLRK